MCDYTAKLCLTPQEAAEQMCISLPTVYALIHSGQLPALRLNRKFIIPRESLKEWLTDSVSERMD